MTQATQAQIPVKYDGQVVGKAYVDSDGCVEVTIFAGNQNVVARNLLQAIREGFCEGLSISPITVPAMPAPLGPPRFSNPNIRG